MVERTSKELFKIMAERGAMGLALDALSTSSTPRSKENYEHLKKKLLDFPSGLLEVDKIQQYLEQLLDYEEIIFVSFKKIKKNGKMGQKKEFKKGFCYYIGMEPDKLSKLYVHWKDEKKFLFENLKNLQKTTFWVEKSPIDAIPNVFCMTIPLSDPERKKMHEAEISLYAGYSPA